MKIVSSKYFEKYFNFQYSLLMKPSTQSLQTGSELARLVDRLTALEACLGENKEDLDNIRVDTGECDSLVICF